MQAAWAPWSVPQGLDSSHWPRRTTTPGATRSARRCLGQLGPQLVHVWLIGLSRHWHRARGWPVTHAAQTPAGRSALRSRALAPEVVHARVVAVARRERLRPPQPGARLARGLAPRPQQPIHHLHDVASGATAAPRISCLSSTCACTAASPWQPHVQHRRHWQDARPRQRHARCGWRSPSAVHRTRLPSQSKPTVLFVTAIVCRTALVHAATTHRHGTDGVKKAADCQDRHDARVNSV